MKRLASAAFFTFVIFAVALPAFSETLVVGTCQPARHPYATIQAAVDAARPRATILVCPGTYAEQVVITTPLTLKGISAPPLPNPTIVGPAAGVAGGPVIGVATHGTLGPVNIQGLVINDPNCMGESNNISAIQYVSTSGAVTGTVIQGFGDPECGGYGILVENDDAWPVNVELANNIIREFQPYGTAFELTSGPSSSRLNVQIHDNLLYDIPTALESSTNGNGVWMYGNSIGTFDIGTFPVVVNDAAMIDHNEISLSATSTENAAIAIEANGNGAVITGNTITTSGSYATGIDVTGDHVRVWSNKITGNAMGATHGIGVGIFTGSASSDIRWNTIDGFLGGIDMGCQAATVVSNTILDSTTGIVGVPQAAPPMNNNFLNDTNLLQTCP